MLLNDGRYVIRPFECKIVGKAKGLARVRASIHTLFAIFDDEEWRIITLFVNHLDSKTKYTDLFAASCGSIGDFTDIKQCDDDYAVTWQMKHHNFPVRNSDGTFYAQVHPFDPSSTLLLRCTPAGLSCSHLITHNSPCCNISLFNLHSWSSHYISYLTFQNIGWRMMEPCLDNSHRWKSAEIIAWLRTQGLHLVPNSIKADIGDLVYNGSSRNVRDESAATPPGRFVFNTGSRASNDPPPEL